MLDRELQTVVPDPTARTHPLRRPIHIRTRQLVTEKEVRIHPPTFCPRFPTLRGKRQVHRYPSCRRLSRKDTPKDQRPRAADTPCQDATDTPTSTCSSPCYGSTGTNSPPAHNHDTEPHHPSRTRSPGPCASARTHPRSSRAQQADQVAANNDPTTDWTTVSHPPRPTTPGTPIPPPATTTTPGHPTTPRALHGNDQQRSPGPCPTCPTCPGPCPRQQSPYARSSRPHERNASDAYRPRTDAYATQRWVRRIRTHTVSRRHHPTR